MPDGDRLITPVAFGSATYDRMTALRDAVLRRPLGQVLTAADTQGEAEQVHIAALEGREVVGTLLLKPAGAAMTIRQVAVDPQRQGTGLGAALVRFAEALSRERGVRLVHLHARTSVAGFYKKLGYHREGAPFVEVGLPHVNMTKRLLP